MPVVDYDLVDGHQVRDTADGQVIVRRCKITGLTILPGTSDSTVLTRAIPFLPSLFTGHPDTTNFPNATLRERNVVSVQSFSQAIIDLVYRGPGPSDFTIEDVSHSDFLETFATAGGNAPLTIWYKKGESSSTRTAPTGSDQVAGSVPKYVPKRVVRVTGVVTKTFWDTWKFKVRSVRGTINRWQWGTDPIDDVRGKWLFLDLITETHDLMHTFNVQLYFAHNDYGWYPVRSYLDLHNEHPPDSATEAQLRNLFPPPVGGSITLNGIGAFSVYDEFDFNTIFAFILT